MGRIDTRLRAGIVLLRLHHDHARRRNPGCEVRRKDTAADCRRVDVRSVRYHAACHHSRRFRCDDLSPRTGRRWASQWYNHYSSPTVHRQARSQGVRWVLTHPRQAKVVRFSECRYLIISTRAIITTNNT